MSTPYSGQPSSAGIASHDGDGWDDRSPEVDSGASDNRSKGILYKTYLGRLWRIVLSSTLAAGLLLGVAMLILGNVTFDINADIGLTRISALWFILGLPLAALLLFLLLSPLSFWLHRIVADDDHRRTNG